MKRTHDLELAAIVHALKHWRHFLLGVKFKIRMDHESLKYLFTQPLLNNRQRGWMNLLSEYDFEIKYIEGKENKVADALSRRPFANAITLIRSDLAENIKSELEHDAFYAPILQKIAQTPCEKVEGKFHVVNGNLYCHETLCTM